MKSKPLSLLYHIGITSFYPSEQNMMRSYEVLVQWFPILKDLSEQGDAESLEILYKNVSFYLMLLRCF
jgi:hypothetical protein